MTAALADVTAAVRSHQYRYRDEDHLQEMLADVLAEFALPVEREVHLGTPGRIDLLVDRVGVEVKIDGKASAIARQLHRYRGSDRIDELVLVTNRQAHVVLGMQRGLGVLADAVIVLSEPF